MRIYKAFTRWWTEAFGGEYQHHCDFVMEEGESFPFELSALTRRLPAVPEGKEWKVHLHFTYHEEDVG